MEGSLSAREGLRGSPHYNWANLYSAMARPIVKEECFLAVPREAKLQVKVQPTRLIKCVCQSCGYVIRSTRKWLDTGYPQCPCGGHIEEELR